MGLLWLGVSCSVVSASAYDDSERLVGCGDVTLDMIGKHRLTLEGKLLTDVALWLCNLT